MKKIKWIIGLSLTGILAVSGTALALTPGASPFAAQTLGFNSNFQTVQNASVESPFSSQVTTPQYSYGGMMGGYNNPNVQGGYNGYGMMGGYYNSNNQGGYNGSGMMGGYGGMGGMMGGGYNASSLGVSIPNGQVTSDDQVQAIANAYVKVINGNFSITEIHEFSDSYEVELDEANTNNKAFEFMIYKNGGYISSEMGPNVMWNTKYGHMNLENNNVPTVTAEQATQSAQDFVNKQMGPSYSIEEPEMAPGYYEFMVLKDGKDYAELDVNGYNGQVWFENWHGPIIKTIETK